MIAYLVLAAVQQASPPDLERLFVRWESAQGIERWMLYREQIHEDPRLAAAFRARLALEGEFGFLEEIALYGGQPSFLPLIEADAPQWIRATLWGLELQDSHLREMVLAHLHQQPGLVRDWLERHGPPSERAAELLRGLVEAGHARLDSSRFLPPLDPEQVFGHLDPARLPAERARWAEGSVEREELVAAIERELAGLSALERHDPPWPERLLALARESDGRVRRAAYLAFTHFRPAEIPLDELLRQVRDPGLDGETRELALLASSYGALARAYLELHGLAADSAHPAWRAALGRLGDLGDGFTLQRLEKIPVATLRPEDRAHLERERARIAEREAALESALSESVHRVREVLERAAWADLACHPLETSLKEWAFATVARWRATSEIRAALEELARSYEPQAGVDPESPFGGLRERVRSYARELLSE